MYRSAWWLLWLACSNGLRVKYRRRKIREIQSISFLGGAAVNVYPVCKFRKCFSRINWQRYRILKNVLRLYNSCTLIIWVKNIKFHIVSLSGVWETVVQTHVNHVSNIFKNFTVRLLLHIYVLLDLLRKICKKAIISRILSAKYVCVLSVTRD